MLLSVVVVVVVVVVISSEISSPVRISFLQGTIFKSNSGVRTASSVPNILPSPSVSIIQKNSTAHKGETGILITASVKAMNVRPGPWAV